MKFYDTNILLSHLNEIDASDEIFYISSVTILELEEIKVNRDKDELVRYEARKAGHWLDEHPDKYGVIMYDHDIYTNFQSMNLSDSHDSQILACAKYAARETDIEFISDDLLARLFAKYYYNLSASRMMSKIEEYHGYQEVKLDEERMAFFYEHINDNVFGLNINEYLMIQDQEGKTVDKYKWTGETHQRVNTKVFKSLQIGTVKPLDDIQECAFDSIVTNEITVLYGKAGNGKTLLPISYAFQGLEKGKISKIYFVYSFQPLKGQPVLGFEKGDHITKILYSASIGNILATKLGGLECVERLIEDNKIDIIPTANIRGVEFEKDSLVIVTEAQNLDVYTLKTIIQRCKEGCKQIYEGDIIEQKDVNISQSGMHRLIEVFKGHNKFGCIKLKNNYRNELCTLADML